MCPLNEAEHYLLELHLCGKIKKPVFLASGSFKKPSLVGIRIDDHPSAPDAKLSILFISCLQSSVQVGSQSSFLSGENDFDIL